MKSKDRYWLLLALALVLGVLYLLWGQRNTACTLYELGFLRYRAAEQLAATESWALTPEEDAAEDAAAREAEAWAASLTAAEGSYTTDSAAGWFGEEARLELRYTLYDQGTGKTAILLHGFGGSEADARLWAPFWWSQGYGVLIPEQRGYQDEAEVNVTPLTYGVYEEFDLYDLILAAGLEKDTVLIHGKGAGAAAALLLAGNEELAGAGVDGIVAETVYDNLGALKKDLLRSWFRLGENFVGRFLRDQVGRRLGFDLDSVDLGAAAANAAVPVLFVAGSEETLLGEARTAAVYESCASDKRLLSLPGAYRALWFAAGGGDYRAAITDFFA